MTSQFYDRISFMIISSEACTMSEKLCLQWNDFKENITVSVGSLRQVEDFGDVTLAFEDGKQVEAHKVILASSSPVFQNILKSNKHAHPLLYMRGMKSEDFLAFSIVEKQMSKKKSWILFFPLRRSLSQKG